MAPRYEVDRQIRDGVEVFTLRDREGARAEIAPALGNNCFAFQAAQSLLEPIPFEVFREKPTSCGIPLLFPFPNRLRDGAFTFRGVLYRIDPPRHGFVRDKAWKVAGSGASDEEGAWICSEIRTGDYATEILSQFPFPFTLRVTHRLKDGVLELQARAENTGEGELPAGFGIHPYFRRPERGTIEVPASKRWELSDRLPTGKLVDVAGAFDLRRSRDLAGLILDDIYTAVTPEASGLVHCHLNDAVNDSRTVIEFPARQFPHVVVYTPPAPRPAICIEPNTCPTDAFNLQERGIEADVLVLNPGQTAQFDVRIYSQPGQREPGAEAP